MAGRDHVISAERLIELLRDLPNGTHVVPNEVRNLALLDPSGDYFGIIDLDVDETYLNTD